MLHSLVAQSHICTSQRRRASFGVKYPQSSITIFEETRRSSIYSYLGLKMLCEACQAIFGNKEPSFMVWTPHHETLTSSQSAVASGCRICSTLREETLAYNRSTFSSSYRLEPCTFHSGNEINRLRLSVNLGITFEYFALVPTSRSDDPEAGSLTNLILV